MSLVKKVKVPSQYCKLPMSFVMTATTMDDDDDDNDDSKQR